MSPAALIGLLGILFFVAVADPDPAWWQWACAFGFSGLGLWMMSFPLRRTTHEGPRLFELQQLWHVWHGWVQREAVPYYRWQVDGFAGPDSEPSIAWRLWPDGDESALPRPRPPERASTDEQFRARLTYEQVYCVYRPVIGSSGQNWLAWFGAAAGIWSTVRLATDLPADLSALDVLAPAGLAVFALLMLWLPWRDLRHDVPRYFELRRMWKRWAAQYDGELSPDPPQPGKYTFNGSPGLSEPR